MFQPGVARFVRFLLLLLNLVQHLFFKGEGVIQLILSLLVTVIARVISESDEHEARGRFEITSTITP